jgi:predicted PurR-regulated permease PerM
MSVHENNYSGGTAKALLVTAAIFIILAGIKMSANLIVPFLLSVFIAIICNPLVAKASQYKIPKAISVTLVIILFVLVALSLASLVGKSLNQLSQSLPEYREQLTVQFAWFSELLARFNLQISNEIVTEYFDPAAALGLATNMLSGLGNVMANLFLIIITVIFMLFEASSLPVKFHFALDDPQMRQKQVDRFLASVNHYMAIKTLVSIATGVCVSVMLWIFGLDFYLLWGVLAFLLNYIPNIGSIIAAIPAMSLAILQLGLAEAGFIGLGYMTINTVTKIIHSD